MAIFLIALGLFALFLIWLVRSTPKTDLFFGPDTRSFTPPGCVGMNKDRDSKRDRSQ
jgi:hypothetical protein